MIIEPLLRTQFIMRKVILFIATSLDGFIAGKDGEIDWLFTDQDYGYAEFLKTIDIVIMGRKTYEQVLTFGEYPYKGMEGYVFSRSRAGTTDENVTFISGAAATFIQSLKVKPGKDIWLIGGSEVIRPFLEEDLVDELVVSIHPIILGDGIPLFRTPFPARELRFTDCKSFDTGLVQVSYVVKR